MEIISTAVIGLVAGTLGKFLLPGKDPGGFFVTIIIGVIGSFIGNFVGGLLPIIPDGEGGLIGKIISATIGAIILLILYRVVKGKK